ncbi:DNA-binding protein [Yersinia ruckeri]|nr:DNA-binding protein [Yersinia ruckeri]
MDDQLGINGVDKTELERVMHKLENVAGWHAMKAYDRTLLCCEELSKAGIAIPSWTSVRTMIGKGSAHDINRAKKDYREKQGLMLRKMDFLSQSLPPQLATMLSSIWEFACVEAKSRFSEEVSEWDSRLEEMQYKVDLANDQLEVAMRQRDSALDKLQGEQKLNGNLESQISELKATLQGEQKRSEARIDELQKQLSAVLLDRENIKTAYEELKESSELNSDKLEREVLSMANDAKQLQQRHSTLESAYEHLKAELVSCNDDRYQIQQSLISAERRLTELREESIKTQSVNDSYLREITRLTNENTQKTAEISSRDELVSNLRSEVSVVTGELKSKLDMLTIITANLNEAEIRYKELMQVMSAKAIITKNIKTKKSSI